MLDCREEKSQTGLFFEPFHKWVFADGSVWMFFFRLERGYLLRFPALADFEVSADGRNVRAYPAPGVSVDTVEHLYLNQVLPLALSRQGKLFFHASAVESPWGAIAFLGESGRGKSTLAASFASSGYRFLTDDGLLLEKSATEYLVQPSHPSIRLWDDSREALVHDTATMAPSVQHTPKARILSDDALVFCDKAQSLRRVYFLGDGSALDVIIEAIAPGEALMGLINHSFLLDIEARDVIAAHFDELAEMVKVPMYYRLDFPRSYDALPAVRAAILRHAGSDNPAL